MPFDLLAEANAAAEQEVHLIEPAPVIPGLVLHVDGDYLAYYASGNDDTSPGEARLAATNLINLFRARTGADSVVVHSSGKACTKGERFLVATVKPYQGQRDGSRKPKNHAYLQQWLQTYSGDLFKAKVWTTREADDGIAYLAEWSTKQQLGYCAIATADKDMQMLPGLHVRWKERDLVRVQPDDFDIEVAYRHLKNGQAVDDFKTYGTKWFWLQMLQGDAADNIPGLEKWVEYDGKIKPVGEKTAQMLLRPARNDADAEEIVTEHYARYYGKKEWADRFAEQAVLLWLRRDHNAELTNVADWFGFWHNDDLHYGFDRLRERVANDRLALNQIAS